MITQTQNYTGECNEAKQSKKKASSTRRFVLAEGHMLNSFARDTYVTWRYKAISHRVGLCQRGVTILKVFEGVLPSRLPPSDSSKQRHELAR